GLTPHIKHLQGLTPHIKHLQGLTPHIKHLQGLTPHIKHLQGLTPNHTLFKKPDFLYPGIFYNSLDKQSSRIIIVIIL
ncbi:MAG: hypothetical protein KKH98_11200, partial [Spirochaetes bacterium]|nr:hypothetical protein [Spirochaetota bacterium]